MNKGKRIGLIIGTAILSIILVVVFSTVAVRSTTVKKSIDLGNKYLAEGNYKEAIIAFEKAIKIDSKNTDVKETLDVLYIYEEVVELIAEGEIDKAQEKLEEIKDMPKFDIIKEYVNEVEEEIEEIRLEENDQILERLNKEEVKNLNKELTQLGDAMTENYDRDDYDTTKLVHSIYVYVMKNNSLSELIQKEIINGEMYFTLTKEKIEEIAKKLFNVEIDHSKFVYDQTYELNVVDDKYASRIWFNEMLVDISIVDKITKVDKNTYSINFTQYTIDDYEYFEARDLIIEQNMLDKCMVIGTGIVEVKEEKVGDEVVYYFSKYQRSYNF